MEPMYWVKIVQPNGARFKAAIRGLAKAKEVAKRFAADGAKVTIKLV
jgi:hypothetical protein